MKEYTIQLEDEEIKALEGAGVPIQTWLNNVIHNRARQAIDQIVQEYSDRQPKKLTEVAKFEIVRNAKLIEPAPLPE